MAQDDFGLILPATKSGTVLASDLNDWRDSVHTMHSGTSRPVYAQAGTLWLDTTAAPIWALKIYDGVGDTVLARIHITDDLPMVAVPVKSSAPTGAVALELYFDSTADLLYVRDEANTAWVALGSLVGTVWTPLSGGAAITIGRYGAVQVYPAGTGTWTKPANLDFVEVEGMGPGGGGGDGSAGD